MFHSSAWTAVDCLIRRFVHLFYFFIFVSQISVSCSTCPAADVVLDLSPTTSWTKHSILSSFRQIFRV